MAIHIDSSIETVQKLKNEILKKFQKKTFREKICYAGDSATKVLSKRIPKSSKETCLLKPNWYA